ncbi:hypothetical protein KHC28_02150 [Ancylobacter sonchi]|uniref:ChuX/HutX family heme-like substrate-binding protein n=1 Tax=Ancylobacter sonchi TaxID=1937790 RepID=UPI001BD254E4|nr:ChuX/HutX family heme-like substrate-binding protein [Ancylobacter sonchi]MBS7532455.1 hypothetical protein [Ancylobacter sonchi]
MASACGRGGCIRPFVSELSVLTAEPGFCGTRLAAGADRVASDFQHLGEAVAVTANTAAVMTRLGQYAPAQVVGACAAITPETTLLRLDAGAVETALAVERMPMQRLPYSLQFYCSAGAILHKCFLTDCRDDLDFARLTHDWERGDRAPESTPTRGRASRMTAGGDYAAQVDSLFGDNGLGRRASLPQWGSGHAWRVPPEMALAALSMAGNIRMPLTKAVGNMGVAQIHNGPLEQVRRSQSLAILSSGTCTLSLDMADVEEAWVTRYEGEHGEAWMLEFYDWRFHCVAQIAAPELEKPGLGGYWEQLLLSLRPV